MKHVFQVGENYYIHCDRPALENILKNVELRDTNIAKLRQDVESVLTDQEAKGLTALHLATQRGLPDVVKTLVSHMSQSQLWKLTYNYEFEGGNWLIMALDHPECICMVFDRLTPDQHLHLSRGHCDCEDEQHKRTPHQKNAVLEAFKMEKYNAADTIIHTLQDRGGYNSYNCSFFQHIFLSVLYKASKFEAHCLEILCQSFTAPCRYSILRRPPPRVSDHPGRLTFEGDTVTDFDLREIHRFLEDDWTSVLNEGVIVGHNYLHVLMKANQTDSVDYMLSSIDDMGMRLNLLMNESVVSGHTPFTVGAVEKCTPCLRQALDLVSPTDVSQIITDALTFFGSGGEFICKLHEDTRRYDYDRSVSAVKSILTAVPHDLTAALISKTVESLSSNPQQGNLDTDTSIDFKSRMINFLTEKKIRALIENALAETGTTGECNHITSSTQ